MGQYELFELEYIMNDVNNNMIATRQMQVLRRAFYGTGNTNISNLQGTLAMMGYETHDLCKTLTQRHKEVSDKIKQRMRNNGINSYKQLSEGLLIDKVSESNLHRLLNEPNILSTKLIIALSKALRMNGELLLEGMGYMEIDKITINDKPASKLDINTWMQENEKAWQEGYDECTKHYTEVILPDLEKDYTEALAGIMEEHAVEVKKLQDTIDNLNKQLENKANDNDYNSISYYKGRILHLEKLLNINRCDYDPNYYRKRYDNRDNGNGNGRNYNNRRPYTQSQSQYSRDNEGVMRRR